MLKYLSRLTQAQTTIPTAKRTIGDIDIKGKDINVISSLKANPDVQFNLTQNALHDAYEENDMNKLKYLKDNFALNLPGQGAYYIDVATEEGNTNMAKFLASEFKCQPSLYAKQMAHINGHSTLTFWLDAYTKQRNDTPISTVHRPYNTQKKAFQWNDAIPEKFRYV